MTAREKLEAAYALAFHPPTLNHLWYQIRDDRIDDLEETGDLLDMALTLHGALPEDGFSSHRALARLALLQARSRLFNTVTFLRNLRQRLGRATSIPPVLPGAMVRDVPVPEFRSLSRGS